MRVGYLQVLWGILLLGLPLVDSNDSLQALLAAALFVPVFAFFAGGVNLTPGQLALLGIAAYAVNSDSISPFASSSSSLSAASPSASAFGYTAGGGTGSGSGSGTVTITATTTAATNVVTATTTATPGAWCTTSGYAYDTAAAVCYKTVTTPTTWTAADAACKGDSGLLIKVDNDAKYSFLVNQISSNTLQTVYIQGKRVDASSNFIYDDGSQITYFKWDQNEPSTGATDLKIRTNQGTNLWTAVDGTENAAYICEVTQ
ncbi:lymphocyte antigen 75-like [Saccostrea cucullata]|uniref:lymphocyte antigen 75-like n=1 Tax=Saccostrea cuccullata TaxID=36930 RepID=UPI002ED659E8